MQRVIIVGAGLIGAALAFQMSRKGAAVTVIEAGAPAQAASGHSFGWINASFFLNPAHHALRVEAMAAHHRLQSLLPQSPHQWQGSLWFESQGTTFAQMRQDLTDLGYPLQTLTAAQSAAREPALRQVPEQALLFPSEGAVDAAVLTRALLAASGARVLAGLSVKGLTLRDGSVTGVRTPIGPMAADQTILAAGVRTPSLLHSIGLDLPMVKRPGLILRSDPVAFRLNHILVSPSHEIRQTPDGCLIAPCAAAHQGDSADSLPDEPTARAATLAHLERLFGVPMRGTTEVGHRPVPADGLPVLGQAVQGLSLAVMHSGVTLAAFAAEALTAQIMGEAPPPLWAPYAPDRLLVKT